MPERTYSQYPPAIEHMEGYLEADWLDRELGSSEDPGLVGPPPTVEIMQFLVHREQETGMYFVNDWRYLAGNSGGITLRYIPNTTRFVLHTHPTRQWYPTSTDFINYEQPDSQHFIASQLGLTRFMPFVPNRDSQDDIDKIGKLWSISGRGLSEADYVAALRKLQCEWELFGWDSIPSDTALQSLLLSGEMQDKLVTT